jgi:hypothetical protein
MIDVVIRVGSLGCKYIIFLQTLPMKIKKNIYSTTTTSKICSDIGNFKQHFSTNFGPKIFKNKSIYFTGSSNSSLWQRHLGPKTRGYE